jgi:DNA primase
VTRRSALASGGEQPERLRETMILALCAVHPQLLSRFTGPLEQIEFSDPELARLHAALLRCPEGTTAATLRDQLTPEVCATLENLLTERHVQTAPPVRNTGDADLAALCLAEELAKLDALRGNEREVREAMEDIDGMADEGLTWRLRESARLRDAAMRSRIADSTDLGEDRRGMSDELQALIDAEVWIRKR